MKSKQFPTHLFAPQPPASHQTAAQIPSPQQIALHDFAGFLTERSRQVPSIYWQPGQPFGSSVRNFLQIKYLPSPNVVPDLAQALAGARLDCARDFHKQLIEFGGAAKAWMTIQMEY